MIVMKVIEVVDVEQAQVEEAEDYAYAPMIYMSRRNFWDWLAAWGERKKIELWQNN